MDRTTGARHYDTSNRLTGDGTQTFTWNNADRLTGRGADIFGYDPLDRLTSSTVSGTSRTYAYNGDGLLQSRTTGGSTVNLLWDRATSPSPLLVSGSDSIVYGLGPLYSVNGSSVTTYARDGQKSIRAEVNGSTVNGSWRYRAYGDVAQSNGSSIPSLLGYSGQLLDPSRLYYMRARWYDAANQRFLSRDPVRGDAAQPQTVNGFGYAAANPIRTSDPTGMCIWVECDAELVLGDLESAIDTVGKLTGMSKEETHKDPISGATIVENAFGLDALLVRALALGGDNTVTFSDDRIVSTRRVYVGTDLYWHEQGHVDQARALGDFYAPLYLAEAVREAVLHGPGSSYRYNAFETNADQRANLPLDWHVPH